MGSAGQGTGRWGTAQGRGRQAPGDAVVVAHDQAAVAQVGHHHLHAALPPRMPPLLPRLPAVENQRREKRASRLVACPVAPDAHPGKLLSPAVSRDMSAPYAKKKVHRTH